MGVHFLFRYGSKKFFRYLLIVIVMQMIIAAISPLYGEIKDHLKTVKIGYFYSEGYQDGKNSKEPKSGLGYEYIQQVANYAGWKCQYVYGSWQTIYQKLLKGDVDVMTDISYTKERSQHMLFSTIPFDRESYYLFVPKKKADDYGQLKSLKGKTVGVTKGVIQTGQLEAWNKKNKAGLILKYYKNSMQRVKAYEQGKTDMTLGLGLGTSIKKNNVPFKYIGSSSSFIVTSKKRPDLVEDVNQAMARLTSTVPRIDSSLAEKYFSHSVIMSELSVKELNWFKKHHTIDIGYLTDMAPFSYTDDQGQAAGTYIDLLKYTFHYYHLNNKLRYHAYKKVNAMIKDLQNEKIDLFVPCLGNAWRSEQIGILQSINMNSTTVSLMTKKGHTNGHLLAVTEQSPMKEAYHNFAYKNYKTVYYHSISDCIKAVRSGEADATLLNSYQISIYLHGSEDLSEKRVNPPLEMTLAIGSSNRYLLDIINRGIVSWKQENISESLMDHTVAKQEITLGDFIKKHFIGALGLAALLAMIITIPITGWIYTKRRRILAEQAANNDLLTGLYSRRAYDEDLDQNLWHSLKDYTVVAMDANGLKKVNDHLGHRAGDEMLKGVATCIQETMHHFNMPGKAYRIGGDEFVIILEMQKKDFETFYQNLLSRIASWHGQLVDHITVSSGYAFSPDDPTLSVRELIAKADELMYHEKQELIRDEDPLLNREDSEVYKRLVQIYKTHLDPKTQLPGAIYFYHIEDEIRKEVEAGGAQLAILAIKIAHVSDDITYCFIRMFGKENLSRFEDCYYVMTSDVQLKVRIEELYKNLSALEKNTPLDMSAGVYVIDHNDHKPIEEICQDIRKRTKICHDHQLHIYDQY